MLITLALNYANPIDYYGVQYLTYSYSGSYTGVRRFLCHCTLTFNLSKEIILFL